MISVLLPVYNGEKYIAIAIKSILNQTFKDFEFLIIDDGSTDDTAKIVNSFNDKRIKYIKKAHTGLADTLNYGLKIAKYDWIARMDADDIALPNRFEIQIGYISKNIGVDIISSWYAVFNKYNIEYIIKLPEKHNDIKNKLVLFSSLCHACSLMKKSIILKLGNYRTKEDKINVFEDYELWLRIKEQVKFYNIQQVLLLVRNNKGSLTSSKQSKNKLVHYNIQNTFFTDLKLHFNIKTKYEQLFYKGLREYFWGNKNKTRKYFWQLKFKIFKYPKALLVLPFTFLNDDLLVKFNKYNLWQRIKMHTTKLTKNGRVLIKELNRFLQESQKDFK